jgi:uncharacterized protein YgiM (DUF1202 family)
MRLITFFLYSLLLVTLTACQPGTGIPASSTSAPVLTVREATNCRTGPGTNYDIAFTYPAGTKLQIVGRYEAEDFWQVRSDKSSTGTCWMWGGSVDVTGNSQTVSAVPPPPTVTSTSGNPSGGTPPEAPSLQKWDYSCSDGKMIFTVDWKDKANDETGYRIFRNGEVLVELPANSTSYTDTLPANQNVEYYIQVYGPSGTENSSVMKAGC